MTDYSDGNQWQDFTYDALNRLTSASAGEGYDGDYYENYGGGIRIPNGNMKQRTDQGTNAVLYQYDGANHLRSVQQPAGSEKAVFLYDGKDRAVVKTVFPTTTYAVNPYFDVNHPYALSLTVVNHSASSGNQYTYRVFDNTSAHAYWVQVGDKLEYDVYLDSSNPQSYGGLDAVFSGGGTLRSGIRIPAAVWWIRTV